MTFRPCLVLLSFFLAAAASAGDLRIGLLRNADRSSLTVYGPCRIECGQVRRELRSGKMAKIVVSGAGVRVGEAAGPQARVLPTPPGGVFVVSFSRGPQEGVRSSGEAAKNGDCPKRSGRTVPLFSRSRGVSLPAQPNSLSPRPYRGYLDVRSSGGRLLAVNVVDVEVYLRSVLPCEMPEGWPMEALRAQAVVARSFAEAGRGRHTREGFDLCDLTHCQVYRGASWERRTTDAAVRSTEREILTWRGRPAPAPYHSTCGGVTTGGLPFLAGVTDPFCRASIHSRWSSRLSGEDLSMALEASGDRNDGLVRALSVTRRDESGRAVEILVKGRKDVTLGGDAFLIACGRTLGWNRIKSTLFTVKPAAGAFVFTGRGLGHGQGLCQWGTRGMALKGRSAREILRHYYPQCALTR